MNSRPNKPHKEENTPIKDRNDDSFHKSIAFALILGQCFGLMPVYGIAGPNQRSLHFTWKSWRVFYCFLTLIGTFFALIMCIYEVFWNKANIFEISEFK